MTIQKLIDKLKHKLFITIKESNYAMSDEDIIYCETKQKLLKEILEDLEQIER